MKTVALMMPTLTSGDAVGNDLIEEYKLLKREGIPVKLFSQNVEKQFRDIICTPDELKDADVIIYHHAIHWPMGEELLGQLKAGTRILRYHNITPPEFFAPYSKELGQSVTEGRLQTGRLVDMCTHFLSDSFYNQQELILEGADEKRCAVVAPFHQGEGLLSVDGDIGLLQNELSKMRPTVLFVGRQAPNKGMHHFVHIAHAYRDFFGSSAAFVWVGGGEPKFSPYYAVINNYIRRNRLGEMVHFTGKVPLSHLKSYYMLAKAFLVVSEHEGFCVPVIEAQAQGVPIVALNKAAVGETAGANQIVFDGLDYDRYATAIKVILDNQKHSADLVEQGRRNYLERFSHKVLEDEFMNYLLGVLKE